MNQEKIGMFIAKCRKENGYTQASLAEKNLVEMRTQEGKANKKAFWALVALGIMCLLAGFSWFAGQNIGEDIGTFIYNISH